MNVEKSLTLSYKALKRSRTTIEDFVLSYYPYYGLQVTLEFLKHFDLFVWFEGYIYRVDEANEDLTQRGEFSTDHIEKGLEDITALLRKKGLLTERLAQELDEGRRFWLSELHVCRKLLRRRDTKQQEAYQKPSPSDRKGDREVTHVSETNEHDSETDKHDSETDKHVSETNTVPSGEEEKEVSPDGKHDTEVNNARNNYIESVPPRKRVRHDGTGVGQDEGVERLSEGIEEVDSCVVSPSNGLQMRLRKDESTGPSSSPSSSSSSGGACNVDGGLDELTVTEVLETHVKKSFDYRALHLLLLALYKIPFDRRLFEFLKLDEQLVDIGDDLVDYEDDVCRNSFNVYRGFVHIWGRDAEVKLMERIVDLEKRHAALLRDLPVAARAHYWARHKEASREKGSERWVFPSPILDEHAYRQRVFDSKNDGKNGDAGESGSDSDDDRGFRPTWASKSGRRDTSHDGSDRLSGSLSPSLSLSSSSTTRTTSSPSCSPTS